MSSPLPSRRPHDPIAASTYELALEIEQALKGDLGLPTGDGTTFDDKFEKLREAYPYLLFGALAMHIADVHLPRDADEPDRARGVIEALQRIATKPELLEAVTRSPFTGELADAIAASGHIELPQKQVNESAVLLQQEVSAKGYFDRSMVLDDQVISLEYVTTELTKTKRFRGVEIEAGTAILLKVIPSTQHWTIKRYKKYDDYAGYSGYIDSRDADFDDVFRVVAVESEAETPKALIGLIGNNIGVGQISRGSRLKFKSKYRQANQEVSGYEKSREFKTVTFAASLRQAYVGDSTEYPLFSRF